MSEHFKLPDFNPDLLDIAMVKSYVSSMKQEYISYWQNTLQHSQKLEFYRSFKTDHTSSSYLDLTRGTARRRALVKLQISNHKLMIEIGRYNQTRKDNRHLPFLWIQCNRTGAPNDNFRKITCSEDDLRSRIFGSFSVKFLACLPLLGFSNIKKVV